jgi:hypothetical protein
MKLYKEKIPDNRKRSIIKFQEWMESTMEKVCKDQMLLCILQTSPYLWPYTGIGFSKRDPNSLWYELWAWGVHQEAIDVNLHLCVFKIVFLLVETME